MEIYAFDAFCPKEVIEKDGVKAVGSAEELYSTCDVVSLHGTSCNCRNEEFHQLCIGEQDAEGRTAGEHSP